MSYYSVQTPLGTMIAKILEEKVSFLQFEQSVLLKNISIKISCDSSNTLERLQFDLEQYFLNPSHVFLSQLEPKGSLFQCEVWHALKIIPSGELIAYSDLAKMIQRPLATRAVASAVARNPIAIIIPCHRVIQKNGKVGNYQAGSDLKEKLLRHEKWRARKDSNLRPSGS